MKIIVKLLLFSLASTVFLIDAQVYETLPLSFFAALNELGQRVNPKLQEIPNIEIDPLDLFTHNPHLSNQTTTCDEDIQVLVAGIRQGTLWSLKIIDSWGKPVPSGLLIGNTFWMGDYEECIEPLYQANNRSFLQSPFTTQYCTAYPLQSLTSPFNTISVGVCLPSSCDRTSIVYLINGIFRQSNFTVDSISCSNDSKTNKKTLPTGVWLTCILLTLMILFVFIGTFIDIFYIPRTERINQRHTTTDGNKENHHQAESVPLEKNQLSSRFGCTLKFLGQFSAMRTLSRIFTMKETDTNKTFAFINGIRVLSLLWVMFGHVFFYGLFYASNLVDVLSWSQNFAFQLINSGVLAVDTFFVLSGFLTAFIFVRQATKEKLSFHFMIVYYLHRYIRLTPTFLLVVLISITLTPYFGTGPFFPSEQGFEPAGCRDQYWWTSILYIANLVKPDDMCLSISWYLHNDMQFHWIAPLALIPFALGKKRIGYLIAALFIFVSIGSIVGILLYYPTMPANGLELSTAADTPSFPNKIYIAPWCRISPYSMGLLTGFLISDIKPEYFLRARTKAIGNILVSLLTFACLFTLYWDSISINGLSRPWLIVYQSLSRWCWSIMISWLIVLCYIQQGGIANRILSCKIWAPIARLNYAAYLIHTTILLTTLLNQKISSYYQLSTLVGNFVSCVFFTYFTAIFIVIFVEAPFSIVERKLFRR